MPLTISEVTIEKEEKNYSFFSHVLLWSMMFWVFSLSAPF